MLTRSDHRKYNAALPSGNQPTGGNVKKFWLPIALLLAMALPATATWQEMSNQRATGASSTAGVACVNAAKTQLTWYDPAIDGTFDGTVNLQFRPNTTVDWETAVTSATAGLTYTFYDPGIYQFYVNYGTTGGASGTVDSFDVNGTRIK